MFKSGRALGTAALIFGSAPRLAFYKTFAVSCIRMSEKYCIFELGRYRMLVAKPMSICGIFKKLNLKNKDYHG